LHPKTDFNIQVCTVKDFTTPAWLHSVQIY
jgi:hypothetical protein